MEKLLLQVLAVVLNAAAPGDFREMTVRFDRLPPECAAVYHAVARKFTGTQTTEIITEDLDGDGRAEMLIYNGANGSAGEGWTVMRKRDDRWISCGEIFGILHFIRHPGRTGVLVECPCGWSYANWRYYEMSKGVWRELFTVGVEYERPIRRHPIRITVAESGK